MVDYKSVTLLFGRLEFQARLRRSGRLHTKLIFRLLRYLSDAAEAAKLQPLLIFLVAETIETIHDEHHPVVLLVQLHGGDLTHPGI
jgi:hypothetical protein